MGPLHGIKVIEIKGIGPGPYAGQLLADMGAEVIVVERASKPSGLALPSAQDVNSRSKKSIALDLKNPAGIETLLRLTEQADVLFEGFRAGVAERLGFGPEVCLERNPKLIYGRLTGWGQTGPLAQVAGHDINYISITGALAAIGSQEKPVPPLNLLGDYAGGSHFLVMGILAALIEVKNSGNGQVVDAAISDGTTHMMSFFHGWDRVGGWSRDRGTNVLDGGAYFYDVYETSDGKFVSIGSLEPQFYASLVEKAGLDPEVFGTQGGPADWAAMKEELAVVFRSRSRQEWCDLLEGTDACFAPVLDYREAPDHPHNKAREAFIELDGVVQPAPAPKFSRSECTRPSAAPREGADTDTVLLELGFSAEELDALRHGGVLT